MQLSHKLHSIFVWNCRTAVKPYKLAEISVLFSKLSQNHLQSNTKKGILKEKRKNGQKGEVVHMKEKETTNAMSCPIKTPEASARWKMILSGVVMLVLMAAITILMIPVMRLMMQEGGKEQLIAKIQSYGIFAPLCCR
jgi:hypothetical protein